MNIGATFQSERRSKRVRLKLTPVALTACKRRIGQLEHVLAREALMNAVFRRYSKCVQQRMRERLQEGNMLTSRISLVAAVLLVLSPIAAQARGGGGSLINPGTTDINRTIDPI